MSLILQLSPSFLDANFVERIAIDVCTAQVEERHIPNLLLESSRVDTDSFGRW